MATFTITMILLKVADSLIPITSRTVSTATINMAGKLHNGSGLLQ